MKACLIRVTGAALRVKLNLPEGVRITDVMRSIPRHDTYVIHLEGIGPDVKEGESLMAVNGDVYLQSEGDLEWQIR